MCKKFSGRIPDSAMFSACYSKASTIILFIVYFYQTLYRIITPQIPALATN